MRTEKTRLLRSGEVAKRLGLHPLTVRRWVKEGKIAAIPIGREARIPITEVERLLGEQRAGIIVLYARVSGHADKEDLQRQVQQLEQWALVARTGQKTVTLTEWALVSILSAKVSKDCLRSCRTIRWPKSSSRSPTGSRALDSRTCKHCFRGMMWH